MKTQQIEETQHLVRCAIELAQDDGTPTMFGSAMTPADQLAGIVRLLDKALGILDMTDGEWLDRMNKTADEVAEADHPKHSEL